MSFDPKIDRVILTLRDQRVILGADLAAIYGVPAKALNQSVKRNAERFPADFMFQLTLEEAKAVQRSRSQTVTLKRGQNIKYLPHAFTEHGALQAANLLNSPRAVAMSIYVIRAFVKNGGNGWHNMLILGDNLQVMKSLLELKKAGKLCNADGTPGVRLTEASYLSGKPEAILEMVSNCALSIGLEIKDQLEGILRLLKRFRNRMDLLDACVVRMSELFRDCQVFTLDRRDFCIYRRNGRDVIPLLSPDD
jgi:hypothetical protein